MTTSDAVVFVVDDDAAMRRSLENLLRSVGFDVPAHQINLNPELRWKKGPAPFGASLL